MTRLEKTGTENRSSAKMAEGGAWMRDIRKRDIQIGSETIRKASTIEVPKKNNREEQQRMVL